jgi:hypothetical protein
VFAQWTVSGFRTVSCTIIHQGEKTGQVLRGTEDYGVEAGIVAINHISALYIVNIYYIFQLMYKQPSSD